MTGKKIRIAASALLLGVIATCAGEPRTAPTVTDSAFVAVMVELLESKAPALDADSAFLAVQRRQILFRHGLTQEQLEEAAADLADDPARALDVWQQIRERVTKGPRGGQ